MFDLVRSTVPCGGRFSAHVQGSRPERPRNEVIILGTSVFNGMTSRDARGDQDRTKRKVDDGCVEGGCVQLGYERTLRFDGEVLAHI